MMGWIEIDLWKRKAKPFNPSGGLEFASTLTREGEPRDGSLGMGGTPDRDTGLSLKQSFPTCPR